MSHSLRLVIGVLWLAGCVLAGCAEVKTPEVPTAAAPAVSLAAGSGSMAAPPLGESRVNEARAAFERAFGVRDGLGPLYNEISCSRCHNRGGVGGSGIHAVTLAGKSENGAFDALIAQGGPHFASASVTLDQSEDERRAIPSCRLSREGEALPETASVVARRRTTALFGLGLVDATPDAVFIALAEDQAPQIRGRAASVTNRVTKRPAVGKFGWKAQAPSLFQFAAQAARVELGITNPLFPDEQAPLGDASLLAGCDLVPGLEDDGTLLEQLTAFMQRLEPVPPLEASPAARAGDALFSHVGCDGCHVRSLRSGPHPIPALSERQYHPYSDFLLHDMGALSDQIGGDGDASPREMRTAPLWGGHLVLSPRLWHDGRAKSFDTAIRLHSGQAAASRDAFMALASHEREQLIAFVATL